MGLIAIDVALIPDEELIDWCVDATKNTEVPLGKRDFLPHTSLFLGCVDEKNIPQIKKEVEQLKAVPITIVSSCEWRDTFHFTIEITPELRALHNRVCDIVRPFRVVGATKEMLVDGEKTGLRETSKMILDSYFEEYSQDKYRAHITLRLPEEPKIEYPIKSNTRLALFQIGDHCTCRREL